MRKFTVNPQSRINPQTARQAYARAYQLARLGYDPRTTLSPRASALFIHKSNLRIADLAFYSLRDRCKAEQTPLTLYTVN